MGAGIDVRCRPLDTVFGILLPKRQERPGVQAGAIHLLRCSSLGSSFPRR